MTTTPEIPKCASQHFGPWEVWPQWIDTSVSLWKQGLWEARGGGGPSYDEGPGYTLDNGIAVIRVEGHIVKGDSSMGGTSSIRTRRAMRRAGADDRVNAVLLHVDNCPGGTVAGSREMANEVTELRKQKPVYTHIDDLCASAGYNFGCRGEYVTANESALVGSIGTLASVTDSSGAAEKQGIKVHVLSTGPHKGAGTPGTPITDEHLAAEQDIVNKLGRQFLDYVNEARGLDLKLGEGAADGRVFLAADAVSLGLIDEVTTFEAAVEQLHMEHGNMTPEQLMDKHPESVASLVDAAVTKERDKLKTEARDDAKAMLNAAGGDHKLAFESFVAGKSLETVEAVAADRAERQAQQGDGKTPTPGDPDKIARLEAQVAKLTEGEEPVAVDGAAGIKGEKPGTDDPRALAEWEYDNDQAVFKASSKERYVNSRVSELKGALKVKS